MSEPHRSPRRNGATPPPGSDERHIHGHDGAARSDHVQSLERGLAVLRAFDGRRPEMTLAEVAKLTGLTRATARRLLLTLSTLGYVRTDGKRFALTPAVLDLGHAYVSGLQLPDIAQPFMEALSERVHESVSASVLDGHEIVYVARVPTQRIMTISLAIGSRLPALWTSMGRVMIADLPVELQRTLVAQMPAPPPTARALAVADELLDELERVQQQGWCLLDQELEDGIRSVAAPLHDRHGRVVAAINIGTHASRVTLRDLRAGILPHLLETARAIDERLAKR